MRVVREDSFNGALYSLKAFGIATALVITGAAASLWGGKAYLGVKDACICSSMSRTSHAFMAWHIPPIPASEAPADEPPLKTAAVPDDVDRWNWPAAQARLAAAYERGGVAQFAEAAVGEPEAEWELERRKRGLGSSSEGQS